MCCAPSPAEACHTSVGGWKSDRGLSKKLQCRVNHLESHDRADNAFDFSNRRRAVAPALKSAARRSPYAWNSPDKGHCLGAAPCGGTNYQSWLFMRTFIDRLSFRTRVVLVICTVLTTYVIVIFQFPS